MKRIAALFPGQGSQVVGMGKLFFDSSEQAKSLFEQADKVLGFSLTDLCFNGPIETLTLTKFAQPALLTTGYVCFKESEIEVVAGAGHSLGEYTALVAAGCISFTDAVQLVHKRGVYMQEAVAAGQGGMIAVMGMEEADINAVIEKIDSGSMQVANFNAPGQIVVAGESAALADFTKLAAEQGGKLIPLNVSAPFHCSLMKPAADALSKDLAATTFNDPEFVVYANVTSQPISSGAEARELLVKQVCGSVRWTQSMQNLIADQQLDAVVEFGPGGVLTKLMKRIDKQIAKEAVFDRGSLETTRLSLQ